MYYRRGIKKMFPYFKDTVGVLVFTFSVAYHKDLDGIAPGGSNFAEFVEYLAVCLSNVI